MKISDFKIKKKGKYYFRGNWDKSIFKKSISIVGSRQMTRYGREVVDKFVGDLVASKVTTISGFMYGIDSEVHQKTVDYGGRTVAVFGCGLDYIYPSENEKLYVEILKNNGLVISEYEPNAKPHLWKFPQRNKIVAELSSLGVLVIEAGENSGSLITAKLAIKLNKNVYAVPGPIDSKMSTGCNNLIKNKKAKMVTTVGDILKIKKPKLKNKNEELNFDNELETRIYKFLELEPLEIDEITRKTDKNIVEISSTLTLMSMKNLISESEGKYYLTQ